MRHADPAGLPGWKADAALLGTLKVAVGAAVLALGFTHVSDDDFARTVIAEQFAHAPKLDPSGTSWLPVPFWVTGAVMAVAGRSLSVARATAVVLGALSVAAPYVAMRAIGVARRTALGATLVAMVLPWNAWLGVATVPEAWTGALAGAAMIAMANAATRSYAAAALLVVSLSRYETWSADVVLAAFCARDVIRGRTPHRQWAVALLALAGPALWLAWNAYAHGDPLHFLARVSAFRRAIGADQVPLSEKLLAYPRVLVVETPEEAALGLVGMSALAWSPVLRRRWAPAAVCVAATFAFLIVGDVRDGAPTHHPARALSPLWWVFVGMGADALGTSVARLDPSRGRFVRGVLVGASIAWLASLPLRWKGSPGRSDVERRDAQIAHGLDMRRRSVASAEIAPCAFEHFALMAAWGRPEGAHVLPSLHEAPSPACPHVVEP
jgi:hypothetical protein